MHIDTRELQHIARAQTAPRLDMYVAIHKALRALMCDTLVALGRLDSTDELDVIRTCGRVYDLLEFCHSHLRHENRFMHPAMERRAPGSSAAVAHEHAEHEHQIRQLNELAGEMVKAGAAERAPLVLALYRALSLFVADNLRHMVDEEVRHGAVLWAHYDDAELAKLHDELVASIPPQETMFTLRWMVPACNPAERAAVLTGMRAQAPAKVFDAVLETVRPHLDDAEWRKLGDALGEPPVATA